VAIALCHHARAVRVSKRVWQVPLALLGVLLAVLVARTLLAGTRAKATDGQAKQLGIDEAAVSQRLAGAIRIPTVSVTQGEPGRADAVARLVQLHAYLADQFPLVHRRLTREVVGEHSLLFEWAGQGDGGRPPILLLAHLDVVPAPAAADWTVPPFEGRIDDEFIWGRGALDDKVSVLGILEAVEHLLAQGFEPTRDIYLAFGGDEEISGLEGARVMADRFADQGLRFEFIVDEGLFIRDGGIPGVSEAVALVGTGSKGYLTLELTARGQPGHSSIPPRDSAVAVLARAIDRLQQRPMPAALQPPASDMLDALTPNMGFGMRLAMSNRWLFGPVITGIFEAEPDSNAMVRTTAAPTVLRAGELDNVMPATATALVNFRIHPSDRIADVVAHVRAAIDDERVQIASREGAAEPFGPTSPETSGYKVIEQALGDIYPEVLVAPALFVAAADIRHYAALSDQLFLFHPLWLAREDGSRIHGIDERIGRDHYRRYIEYYVRLMQIAAGPAR